MSLSKQSRGITALWGSLDCRFRNYTTRPNQKCVIVFTIQSVKVRYSAKKILKATTSDRGRRKSSTRINGYVFKTNSSAVISEVWITWVRACDYSRHPSPKGHPSCYTSNSLDAVKHHKGLDWRNRCLHKRIVKRRNVRFWSSFLGPTGNVRQQNFSARNYSTNLALWELQ